MRTAANHAVGAYVLLVDLQYCLPIFSGLIAVTVCALSLRSNDRVTLGVVAGHPRLFGVPLRSASARAWGGPVPDRSTICGLCGR